MIRFVTQRVIIFFPSFPLLSSEHNLTLLSHFPSLSPSFSALFALWIHKSKCLLFYKRERERKRGEKLRAENDDFSLRWPLNIVCGWWNSLVIEQQTFSHHEKEIKIMDRERGKKEERERKNDGWMSRSNEEIRGERGSEKIQKVLWLLLLFIPSLTPSLHVEEWESIQLNREGIERARGWKNERERNMFFPWTRDEKRIKKKVVIEKVRERETDEKVARSWRERERENEEVRERGKRARSSFCRWMNEWALATAAS